MPRKNKEGFLKGLLKYSEHTEIPEYFAFWSGVAAIAGCLGRACFMDFIPIVYPNVYIVLVAESALCRKSTAIDLATSLLERIEDPPQSFAQKATSEGLIRFFKSQKDKKEVGAQGMLIADELSTLLDRQSYSSGLVALLTSLYDSHKSSFKYLTAGHGVEKVHKPCLTMLGGTTLTWLRGSIPPEVVGGGFTSRVIFVSSQRSPRRIAWPRMTLEMKRLRNGLVYDLNEINKIEGEFIPTTEAKELYTAEYGDFLDVSDESFDDGLHGYMGRRHFTMLKLSIIISASHRSSKTVTVADMKTAKAFLKETELTMPQVIRDIQQSPEGEIVQAILKKILKAKSIQRSVLMRSVSNKIKAVELDSIILTLKDSGLIKVCSNGRSIRYEIIDRKVQ